MQHSLTTAPTKTQQVIDGIKAQITSGALLPGARMLGMRELGEHFGASFSVVRSACAVLERERLIVRRDRSGTFVNPDLPLGASRLAALFTDVRRGHHEGYFESLLQATGEGSVVPMIGALSAETNWQRIMRDSLERQPNLALLDVEARRFDLDELLTLVGRVPCCVVNRWEWHGMTPRHAVLFDYLGGYVQALNYLRERGHRRILMLTNHQQPQPYLRTRIEQAAEAVGLAPAEDLHLVHALHDYPHAMLTELLRESQATAVFGQADYLVHRFFQALAHVAPVAAAELDRVGFYDQHYSRLPGHEFSSVHLPFATLWPRALARAFAPADDSVVYIPPTLIIRKGPA